MENSKKITTLTTRWNAGIYAIPVLTFVKITKMIC